MANGNKISLEIRTADLVFEGEVVGGTIIYGEEGAEPLLVVKVLVSGGISPLTQGTERHRP